MADGGKALRFDVLVVGAGIAGTTAALAAAGQGARVAMASSGASFSGSSSFGGTWGLGLVGPDGAQDADGLAASILEVGRGTAVPELARALVGGIGAALDELARRGVELAGARNADEPDFIPCFDRKHRDWHGLGRASYREATARALDKAGVALLPRCDLLDLLEDAGGVCGAALFDRAAGCAREVAAGAVVLATGGFGGLFGRTLTLPDVTGTAAAVALGHGARLVNAEFIQIMPGLVAPVKNVVFNERTFRYASVEGFSAPGARRLLASRAAHGPFTASLPDRAVDLAVVAAGRGGAAVSYELPERLPEFMQTYFTWFEDTFARSPAEGARIAAYAHASNGGVLVGADASAGADGLFACGEATGGMHGADRIGGLASANALVFGGIAGRSAAAWAAGRSAPATAGANLPQKASPKAAAVWRELRETMDEHCLVVRTEEGLAAAAEKVSELEERLDETALPCPDAAAAADTVMARHALLSASALVCAMRARAESRGAHFRADFPEADPAQARPLAVRCGVDPAGRRRVSAEALAPSRRPEERP